MHALLTHPLLRLSCFGTTALVGAVAGAQPSASLPTTTVTDRDTPRLKQPVSTGSRLDLTPMQTPASVDVIDRSQLEARGDAALVDAVTRSAGIASLAHPGNSGSSLSARGFTDTTSVMRLYDGTRQYGGMGVSFPFDTWSIDRIEVLRGPASVVHGDGAIGGVVNVVPKKPGRGPVRHEVESTAGSRGQRALAFGSGGAVDDRLAYRFDIRSARSDGWVDRGESRTLAFSGAVRLDVSPDLQLSLSHAQGRQRPARYFGTPLVDGVQLAALRRANYNVADSRIDFHDRWTELAAQWSPGGGVVLRSKLYRIDSDRYWRNAEIYVYNPAIRQVDRSGNTEIAHDQSQTGSTTDASFAGTVFGLSHQLSVGFDLNRSGLRHSNNTYAGSSGPVDVFDPAPGRYASTVPFLPRYRNTADQYAMFAEDRLELGGRWSLVGGTRFDHAEVARRDLVVDRQAFDRRYAHIGWRVGTVYQPRPALSVYAQYAQAADPVDGMLMLSPANSAFDVSTGRQFEVGLKQAFRDRRGDWTLAAYTITKNRLLTRDPADPALGLQVGQRSSKGIESTVSVALSTAVQLDANLAVLKARYDDFAEAVGGVAVSRDGKVPTDVPQRLANVWIGWRLRPDWTVSGGVRHVGKRYADNANTLVLPAYSTTDFALQWRATPATVLSLRGFNLFDKRYFTTSYYTTTQWFVGEGRRVELTLNHRF
ncbi:TonB-dependent receptor [Xylophilus ampelinus]|uniref:Iron complex outermembrane receptor protein n=1 Tax=Xylophilus ampelinus TaxID=54067 RepID=A0A318SGS9_9BURK|nr:iron complex outermembrane receptor protein [Xylophilus ampelinus]